MNSELESRKYPYAFLAIYALTYIGNASFNSFIPVYLDNIGFNKSAIGVLLAIGPFVTLLSQPVWGSACDRAKEKNTILKVLLLCSAALNLLFPVTRSFSIIFVIMLIFTFFHSPINNITDAITLEYLENKRWKFGPIRLAGTIGFALISVLTGALARINIYWIFAVYILGAVAAFAVTCRLPGVKGHRIKGSGVNLSSIFKNREMLMLLGLNLVFNVSYGFYASFFPVYYKTLGADNLLLGVIMFLSSMSELPFLLFSDRIVNRLGIKLTLLISSIIMGIRMALLFLIKNIYLMFPVSLLHGITNIVFVYSMATYMNNEVPRELKAAGQTINGFIAVGVARIIGNIAGGYLSDIIGIERVFIYLTALELITALIFSFITYKALFLKKHKFS